MIKNYFEKLKIIFSRNDKLKFTFYHKITAIFLVAFSFSLLNCSQHKSTDLETLSKIYIDLLVVEDFYVGTDSVEIKKKEIFKKYEIDSSTYFNSYRNLKYDDEKWNEFFNLSQTYLDSLKSKQQKN
ncbi:MAG: hypothetical protein IPH62_12790 [Ignavibacteriae bacterium]|nr:hypothetical protein [Ignavibacteriota bacterium]